MVTYPMKSRDPKRSRSCSRYTCLTMLRVINFCMYVCVYVCVFPANILKTAGDTDSFTMGQCIKRSLAR